MVMDPRKLQSHAAGTKFRNAMHKQESVPIGKPQQGVVIRIVDEWYRLVPKGQKGKILIGGRGVSAGYRNEPERTAIFFKQLNHLEGTLQRRRVFDVL